MAITTVRKDLPNRSLERHSDASAADTALTLSTPSGQPRRVLYATVKYSAPVTVNVTCTLNSGVGPAYDTLLPTMELIAAANGLWIPDAELVLYGDEMIDVLAPAGGAGITSALAIYTEPL